ncbi:MAG: S8 family serine peptidase [Deltaproteobacteria bacterium]|nr:S8 family serine peptidase [Deltaproteobacteria bacterium]
MARWLNILLLLVPFMAYAQEDPGLITGPYVEGEIFIRYKDGTQEEKQELMALSLGATLKKNDFLVPNLKLVQLYPGQPVEEAIQYFKALPDVLYVAPNYLIQLEGGMFPPREIPDPDPDNSVKINDPYFNNSYGLYAIEAPKAWKSFTWGSRNVMVAIIDSGIDYTHEDLASNMWKNPNEIEANGIDDDGNGYIDDQYGWNFLKDSADPMDDNFHGTHVAGIVGALADNGVGSLGVSPSVSLMACKFTNEKGEGTTNHAIRAITYAVRNGAKILNNSWGGYGKSRPLMETIQMAANQGVLFVAAAGNDNADADVKPFYPASFTQENVISVAATDAWDEKASFSNFGKKSVHLAAPGVSIFSSIPKNRYDSFSGTSMAAPFVSGAAALIWAAKPHLTMKQVKDLLLQTVDPIESMQGRTMTGGRLNIYNALSFSILSP